MKKTYLVLLLLFIIACVSCGGKPEPKPVEKPSKDRAQVRQEREERERQRKQREEEAEAARAAEEARKLAENPPRPEDITVWKKSDYMNARKNDDKKLMEACALLGEPYAGNPAAGFAVKVLKDILAPVEPPEFEELVEPEYDEDMDRDERRELERQYEDRKREQEDRMRNIPKLSSQDIVKIMEIAVDNGDDSVWAWFLDIWMGDYQCDDNPAACDAVLKLILENPRTNNIDIIYRMITEPETLRPAESSNDEDSGNQRKDRATPDEIQKAALQWAARAADPEFKLRLTNFILSDKPTDEQVEKIVPMLLPKTVGNLPCQIIMAHEGFFNDEEQTAFNEFVLKCAPAAMSTLIDQVAISSTDLLSIIKRQNSGEEEDGVSTTGRRRRRASAQQNPAPTTGQISANAAKGNAADGNAADGNAADGNAADATAADGTTADGTTADASAVASDAAVSGWTDIDPYVDMGIDTTNPQKTFIVNPHLAIAIVKIAWQDSFYQAQKSNWEMQENPDFNDRNDQSFYLMNTPLEGVRGYWRKYYEDHWSEGPEFLSQSPFHSQRTIDPGLILSLKAVKRACIPEAKLKTMSKSGNTKNDRAVLREQQMMMSQAWMDAVRSAVKVEMNRCIESAKIQEALNRDNTTLRARIPFQIPKGAQVVTEFHTVFPNASLRDLKGLPLAPLEIHYVKLEWETKLGAIEKVFRHKDGGAVTMRTTANQKEQWLELYKNDGTLAESLDVMVDFVTKNDPRAQASYTIHVLSLKCKAE